MVDQKHSYLTQTNGIYYYTRRDTPLVNVSPNIIAKCLISYASTWHKLRNKHLKLVIKKRFPDDSINLDELNEKIDELEPMLLPIVRHVLLDALTNKDGADEDSTKTTKSINAWLNHFVRYIEVKRGTSLSWEALEYLFESLANRLLPPEFNK